MLPETGLAITTGAGGAGVRASFHTVLMVDLAPALARVATLSVIHDEWPEWSIPGRAERWNGFPGVYKNHRSALRVFEVFTGWYNDTGIF